MRSLVRLFLILSLCFALAFVLGCAEKSSGNDDDDDEGDDDTPPESGVGSYTIHLNMVATLIGESLEPTGREVYDAAGDTANVEAIALQDYLAALTPFAEDADGFDYLFLTEFEDEQVGPISYADLADAVFYEDTAAAALCLGFLSAGHETQSLCGLELGWIVTVPQTDAFDFVALSDLNTRTGETPDHLGETVAVQAIVHTGTNTVVSGTYVKAYLQQDGYGVKVFADAGATETNQGYDGQLVTDIETFIGDEVFVLGRVTVHDGMIELVPKSGYHLAVVSIGNDVAAPSTLTIDELAADRYRYAAALVRLNDVEIVDVNPDIPTTDWPMYGTKSKDISIRHTSGGAKMVLPVYENTGLPGSDKPAAGFDLAGAFEVSGSSNQVYPRRIEDINPSAERLAGQIKVSINGENKSAVLQLDDFPTGLQPIGDGGALVPVVSLAEIIRTAGLTRNPRVMTFKPVAYDDRQPFQTAIWEEMKSGMVYQGTRGSADQPDPMLNSYFWPQMGLSDIYYLNGVNRVAGFRTVEPPEEGEADYGEGMTLIINGTSFAVPFEGLTKTEYDGQEAIAVSQLISDGVIELFTMSGSFTTDQIKLLYDYRFVNQGGNEDVVVRFADLAGGYLLLGDDPRIVFPELGDSYTLDEVLTVDMMRYIQVEFGDGSDPVVVYLRDCDTESVENDAGETVEAVFYDTVAVAAGIEDTDFNKYLYDYWLVSADEFVSTWSYGHGHFDHLYIIPYENSGFTTDFGEHSVGAYGGRASTKAVYEIQLAEVPREAPSIPVVSMLDGETVIWGTDANTCEGCHWKSGELHLEEINCYSCHAEP
ncbi:MAG: hypothetical protein P9L99_13140 [Candidatus Lernaella stagnicola]|nr:hypothetical protein [Candidatus Lernaella stagnicola]